MAAGDRVLSDRVRHTVGDLMTDISMLRQLAADAETIISGRQDDLSQSAAALAAAVGPLAASHRLAELAIEMRDLARMTGACGNG